MTDFTPIPALGVYKDSAGNQAVFPLGNPPTFSLTTNTTYYLFDDEVLPQGVPHPGAQFHQSGDSNSSISAGDTLIGSTAGNGPQSFAPAACSSSQSCYLKVTVQGATRASKYTASSGGGGGGGDGGGSPTLVLSGPSDGVVGAGVTFSATRDGFLLDADLHLGLR